MFGSWVHHADEIDVIPKKSDSHDELFIENPEWALMEVTSGRNEVKYECCPEPYVIIISPILSECVFCDFKYNLRFKSVAGQRSIQYNDSTSFINLSDRDFGTSIRDHSTYIAYFLATTPVWRKNLIEWYYRYYHCAIPAVFLTKNQYDGFTYATCW